VIGGRYRLEALLGAGGMGEVHLAFDTRLQRRVALKLVRDARLKSDDERTAFVARALREARAAAALRHPSVVTVHDFGEEDGAPYVVLEYLEGEPLSRRIGRTDVPLQTRLAWLRDVALALAAAHDAGLIHRDIKPDNVFVCADGAVKVLDFGIAKHVEVGDGVRPLTAEGAVIGTPGYMSPEQMRGETLDARSDQFSWGVLAYELLTGALPWTRTNEIMPLMLSVIHDEPAPPTRRVPGLPKAIDVLVARAMQKTREARFDSMKEIAALLAEVASSAEGQLAPLGHAKTELLPSQAQPTADASRVTADDRPRRIIDPPFPNTQSPGALTEYREALAHLRDANKSAAHKALLRALELDPNFAAAALRASFTGLMTRAFSTDARAHYRRALDHRRTLSARDRALLHAIEPLALWDPPDTRAFTDRCTAASVAFPNDAEILSLCVSLGSDCVAPAEAIVLVERAAQIDPEYAAAFQDMAHLAGVLGDDRRALAFFDQALAISPNSADLYSERAFLHLSLGDATSAESDARRSIALDANPLAYQALVGAMFAAGRPAAAIRAVYKVSWALEDATVRPVVEAYDEAQLAVLAGDLVEARRIVEDVRPKARANVADLGRIALVRIECATELGDTNGAAEIAMEYLSESAAATTALKSAMFDATPHALAAAERGGLLSREEAAAQRERWLDLPFAVPPGILWARAYAPAIELSGVLDAARARLEKGVVLQTYGWPLFRIDVGRVLFALGRREEGVKFLRAGAMTCRATSYAFRHVHAHVWLGDALEQMGDRDGAIAAYGVVIKRWGRGALESKSVRFVTDRLAALGSDRLRSKDQG